MTNEQKRKLMKSLMEEMQVLFLATKTKEDYLKNISRITEINMQLNKLADEIRNGDN